MIKTTTLGLHTQGGYSFPITLEDITPRKVYKAKIKSRRLGTEIIEFFTTSTQRARFIESMNDNQYFLVNAIK